MVKRKKNIKTTKADKKLDQFRSDILEFLNLHPSRKYSHKQIRRKLDIAQKHIKNNVEAILNEMSREGKIKCVDYKYSSRIAEIILTGVVDYVSARNAFIVSDEIEKDVYVRSADLKNALDDDIVKVRLIRTKRDGRPVGEVVEIVERNRMEFVGRIEILPQYGFVIPDFKKMHHDIFIRPEGIKKAKNNDKVIVRIIDWKYGDRNPVGEVIDVLGPAGDNEAEIHSIMAEFGLPFNFPKEVIHQAELIDDAITEKEVSLRKDFRKVTTFTIDPEDAKDFDDAISFRQLKNGNYEVGIHIADVTHYVKPDTLLDKGAFQRATSVYLVDRTVPMIPERLSNNLCSLRPKEDKLTFSAVFELNHDAVILNEWFGRTIIHSDRRFAYEEAQDRIETISGDFSKELTILNELALKLRIERYKRGAVNFETTEVKFQLDEKGKPLGIVPKVRKDAHKLIEEFMLLANKRVAEKVFNMRKGRKNTFVYRTHDNPDPEKLNSFANFAKKFGHNLNVNSEGVSSALNSMLGEIEGKPEQNVLQNLAIRSMAKAKYTTDSKGHFGLAFPHYTHFTSPIRRYPDMMVHRLLQHYLDGGKPVSIDEFEDKCLHSSEREKVAADAERASIKYKQVEYMSMIEERIFEGLITGVMEWGIFVEITSMKIEGMVRMSSMTDDFYELDEKNYRVVGRHNLKIFTLGDKVTVEVVKTDIDRRLIDLEFADDE